MRCIAVINQKGGVGKTTTTVSLGAAFARAGHKVLLLDIDPQANLTLHLDRRPEGDARTMTDLLVEGTPLRDIVCETSTPGLYMVPADTSLSGVETQLANRIGRETILREALEQAADGEPQFDYVFLDCPPSLGVLSANALVAAEHVLIPMQAEYFSMQGMTKLMEVMDLVRKCLNPSIDICLILPCMVDRRTNLTNEVLSELRRHFGDVLADTCIRSNVKLAEAPSFGRTIFEHAPESNGARDYQVVADELLRRLEGTFEPATIEEPEEEVAAVELEVTGTDDDEPHRAELESEFASAIEPTELTEPGEPAAAASCIAEVAATEPEAADRPDSTAPAATDSNGSTEPPAAAARDLAEVADAAADRAADTDPPAVPEPSALAPPATDGIPIAPTSAAADADRDGEPTPVADGPATADTGSDVARTAGGAVADPPAATALTEAAGPVTVPATPTGDEPTVELADDEPRPAAHSPAAEPVATTGPVTGDAPAAGPAVPPPIPLVADLQVLLPPPDLSATTTPDDPTAPHANPAATSTHETGPASSSAAAAPPVHEHERGQGA